jgi:hypothetical protein
MVDILSVLVEEMEVTVWSHRVVVVEAQSRSRGWGELRCVLLDMVTLAVDSATCYCHLRDMSWLVAGLGFAKAVVGK